MRFLRPISQRSVNRFAIVSAWITTTALLAGCESKRPDTVVDNAGKPKPSDQIATQFDFAAVEGIVAKREGDAVVMLDLRGVPAMELKDVITEAVKLPKLAEVVFGGEAANDQSLAPLAQSVSVRRIKAAGTGLGDATLAKLAAANRIELLDLTDVTGVTPTGVELLGRMNKLRNLRVSGPSVDNQSVAAIGKLTNLAALTLQQTAVTDEGISKIHPLAGLKELSLYGTAVTDAAIAWLSEMPELGKLRLRGTKVTGQDAGALAVLPVVDLELAETDFGNAGMPAVAAMSNLQKLNLWLTQVDDSGLAHLEGKTDLVLLNLDNVAGITDESLGVITGLVNLELLHLGGTGISPDRLPALYGLKRLKTLFVTRMGVTQAQAELLRQAMPWLEQLEY